MFLAFIHILFSQAKYKKDLTSVDRNWKSVNALKKQSSKLTRVNEFPGKFILVLPSESSCFEYLLKSNVGNESLLPLVLDRKHCCSYSFHIYCWFAETFGNISSLHLCLLTQQIAIDKLLWGSTCITLLMEHYIIRRTFPCFPYSCLNGWGDNSFLLFYFCHGYTLSFALSWEMRPVWLARY